ncbi:MAG: hypothetical protein WAW42_03865 [Candidatus Competibacteraceae bacterium]
MDDFRMMLDQALESIIIPEPSRRLVASLFGVTMVEWVERGPMWVRARAAAGLNLKPD